MKFKKFLYYLNRRDHRLLPKSLTATKIVLILLFIFTAIFTTKIILAEETETTTVTNPTLLYLKEHEDAIKQGNNLQAWDANNTAIKIANLQQMLFPVTFDNEGNIITNPTTGGVIGTGINLVSSLFYQPASGIEYIAGVKNTILGKPAYAQDETGFTSLQGIQSIWKTFRNVFYILCTLLFTVLGVMIMLRIKISPQATITVQSVIPKIIITLILVTFSYAIAGLIIDITNFLLPFILAIFFQATGNSFDSNIFTSSDLWTNAKDLTRGGGIPVLSWAGNLLKLGYTEFLSLFGVDRPFSMEKLSNSNFYTLYNLVNRAIPGAIGVVLGKTIFAILFGLILGGAGNLVFGAAGQDLLGWTGAQLGNPLGSIVGGLVIPIILAIVIVILLIKLYFGLLKAYIMVILKIIIAPLEIGIGAIPNSKVGFGSWFTGIIANILVFPTITVTLVLINFLTDAIKNNNLWTPPQLDLGALSGNGLINTTSTKDLIAAGVGIAGLTIVAKLPKLIPEAIFKLKDNGFGSALGEGLKPAIGIAKFGGRTGGQYGADIVQENYNTSTTGPYASGAGKGLTFLNSMRKAAATTGLVKDKN